MQHDKRRRTMLVTEDCFAALVRAFKASEKFKTYSPGTQRLWGDALDFAARPDCLGALSLQEIRPILVQAFFDGLAGRPGKQAYTLRALTQIERWSIARDYIPRPITMGVEIGDSDGGHVPWSDEQVALGERYARPDLARAITLGANTGQRGSDLIRMGWTDIEHVDGIDGINVRQVKTGVVVWVPILPPLANAMATWERRPGPFLLRPDDRAWTRKELTDAWTVERVRNEALRSLLACGPDKNKPLVLHGLRGHACVRLVRQGINTRQISDMIGMSEENVKVYTRFSSQRDNAVAAVHHLRGQSGNASMVKSNGRGR